MAFKNKYLNYFRDLGDLTFINEPVIKKGLLFRSSDWSDLTQEEAEEIRQGINLGQMIDLRTEEEVVLEPDIVPEGVIHTHLALLSKENNPAVTRATRISVLKKRMKEPEGMVGHMTSIYPLIISSPQSIEGLKRVFNIILNKSDDKSILYHCTQGKDRTGITSVLLLTALGFSKEAIIRDYLRYNHYHRMKRFWIFTGMMIVFFSIKTARSLDAALVTKRRYIDAAYKEMDEKYGGPIEYLKKGLGLTEEDIEKLKSIYLER